MMAIADILSDFKAFGITKLLLLIEEGTVRARDSFTSRAVKSKNSFLQ